MAGPPRTSDNGMNGKVRMGEVEISCKTYERMSGSCAKLMYIYRIRYVREE